MRSIVRRRVARSWRATRGRAAQAREGFTLLEILISALLFTVAVVALAQAFSLGLFATSDVENIDLALNIAQAKMEEVKDTAFASLADSGPTADADFPRFGVTVNVAEGDDPMEVTVTVSWSVKGGQTSVALTTLRTSYYT